MGEGPSEGAGAGSTVAIELLTPAGFRDLDRSIAPTVTPTVQLRGSLPSGFRVFDDRPDGSAGVDGGPSGFGKEVTAALVQVAPGTYRVSFSTLPGIHTVVVTDAESSQVLASATMLSYSTRYEDLNGNRVLDTGEDLNHNGVLDDGEDVDGDGFLDLDEDLNGNGVLDPGEDLNGNGLLDPNEDVNGNRRLDLDEDLNGDGVLDPGEDLNGNGRIDPVARDVGPLRPSDELVENPFTGTRIFARSLILDLVPWATAVAVSEFLQENRLQPLGVSFGFPRMTTPRLVVVEVPEGLAPYELQRRLNGVTDPQETLPATTPVDPPLNLAISDAFEELADLSVPSEALPRRLVYGGGPNAGQSYDPADGSFDDSGGGVDLLDELDLSWHHFFLDTFAAHRLAALLRRGVDVPFDRVPTVAIVDTGLGDGTQKVSGGGLYRGMTLQRITDCTSGTCSDVTLDRIPDQFATSSGIIHHGTAVTHFAAGDGSAVLGTARSLSVHVWPLKVAGSRVSISNALREVARDPRARAVNLSWGFASYDADGNDRLDAEELARFERALREARPGYRDAIRALEAAGKILTVAAGNEGDVGMTDGESFLRLFRVPSRGDRSPGGRGARFLGVGATSRQLLLFGREAYATFSQFGPRVSVSAPGDRLACVDPSVTAILFDPDCAGTSFAAPMTAGLAVEVLALNNIPGLGVFTPYQAVELIEATADDLGTGGALVDDLFPAVSEPGDGPDSRFGWGRINVWKALLSRANGGVARESHTEETRSRSLDRIADADTRWYGFRIVTSLKGATVWRDGDRLVDPGAALPNPEPAAIPTGPTTAQVTAYKGVRSDIPILYGIDVNGDGVLDENPTDGVVPVGTETPGRGEHVITFSIPREELVGDGGAPRVLSLREPGATANDPPFYNLLLELPKMRAGLVPGVVFDDFVFEVTPADFGDAFDDEDEIRDYPSLLIPSTANRGWNEDLENRLRRGIDLGNGARHLNTNLEWLGKPGRPNHRSVSGEVNATVVRRERGITPDPSPDPDGQPNFHDRPELRAADLDRRDDGVTFFPLTYEPGGMGKVRFNACSFYRFSSRYRSSDPGRRFELDRLLWVNAWFDWNTDGRWSTFSQLLPVAEEDETVIRSLGIYPPLWELYDAATDRLESSVVLENGTVVRRVSGRRDCGVFEATFPVPDVGDGELWARFRLDYGEDVGRNDPRNRLAVPRADSAVGGGFRSDDSLRDADRADGEPQPPNEFQGHVHGATRFGEVEDYLIGSDFGDAKDPFSGAEGRYPTLLASRGGHHLDIYREWLGPGRPRGDSWTLPGTSRERDACDRKTDQDHHPNLDPDNLEPFPDPDPANPDCDDENRDLLDDGLILPPAFPPGGTATLGVIVRSTIASRGYEYSLDEYDTRPARCGPLHVVVPDSIKTPRASREKGRYDPSDRRERLWLHVWADWNGDGDWDDPGELVVRGPLDPPDFGKDGKYTLGEPFDDRNGDGVYEPGIDLWEESRHDVAGVESLNLQCEIPVPEEVAPRFYLRARLSYGERAVGDAAVAHHSDAEQRRLDGPRGGAFWGEVEDYPFPPLVKTGRPDVVAPGETIHYTLRLPGAATLEQATSASIRDPLPDPLAFHGNLSCDLGDCRFDSQSRTVVWTGELQARQTVTVEFDSRAPLEVSESLPEVCNDAEGFDGVTEYRTRTCVRLTRPPAGTVQFSTATYHVVEGDRVATISVVRRGDSQRGATVDFSTSDDTATAGSDYRSASGSLTWPAGDLAARTFTVPILDDALVEGTESVELRLGIPRGTALGHPAVATLLILDDEVDCNDNGIPDDVEIEGAGALDGSPVDVNANGVLDECEIGRLTWRLRGEAEGGEISMTLRGFTATCTVTLPTVAGQSAATVAANLALVINEDPCTTGQGMEASASGGDLTITGFVQEPGAVDETISDPGLHHEVLVLDIPLLGLPAAVLLSILLALLGVGLLGLKS